MEGLIQQNIEKNILQAAKTIEDAVDAQIHRLENLQEDDLELIRRKRIDDMKKYVSMSCVLGCHRLLLVVCPLCFLLCFPSSLSLSAFVLVASSSPPPPLSLSLSLLNSVWPSCILNGFFFIFRLQSKRQEWLARGHGELREVSERDFFQEMKGEERMVCLFYRESPPCQAMEKHLGLLAKSHIETKFVKVLAEKAPFLAERLRVWMLPTVAIIQNEKTTDYIVGLDELGGTEDFSTSELENRLATAGAILEDPQIAKRDHQEDSSNTNLRKGGSFNPRQRTASDEDSDFD